MIEHCNSLLPNYLNGPNIQKHCDIMDSELEKLFLKISIVKNILKLDRPILFKDEYTVICSPNEKIISVDIYYEGDHETVSYNDFITSVTINFDVPIEYIILKTSEQEYVKYYEEIDSTIDILGNLVSIQRLTEETDFNYINRLKYFSENFGKIDTGVLYARLLFNTMGVSAYNFNELYTKYPREYWDSYVLDHLDEYKNAMVYKINDLLGVNSEEIINFVRKFNLITRNIIFHGLNESASDIYVPLKLSEGITGIIKDVYDLPFKDIPLHLTCEYIDGSTIEYDLFSGSDGKFSICPEEHILALGVIELDILENGDITQENILKTNIPRVYDWYESNLWFFQEGCMICYLLGHQGQLSNSIMEEHVLKLGLNSMVKLLLNLSKYSAMGRISTSIYYGPTFNDVLTCYYISPHKNSESPMQIKDIDGFYRIISPTDYANLIDFNFDDGIMRSFIDGEYSVLHDLFPIREEFLDSYLSFGGLKTDYEDNMWCGMLDFAFPSPRDIVSILMNREYLNKFYPSEARVEPISQTGPVSYFSIDITADSYFENEMYKPNNNQKGVLFYYESNESPRKFKKATIMCGDGDIVDENELYVSIYDYNDYRNIRPCYIGYHKYSNETNESIAIMIELTSGGNNSYIYNENICNTYINGEAEELMCQLMGITYIGDGIDVTGDSTFNVPSTVSTFYLGVATFNGTLLNEDRPVKNVKIQLLKNTVVKAETTTNNDGEFSIQYQTESSDFGNNFTLKYIPTSGEPIESEVMLLLDRHDVFLSLTDITAQVRNMIYFCANLNDENGDPVENGVLTIELEQIQQ